MLIYAIANALGFYWINLQLINIEQSLAKSCQAAKRKVFPQDGASIDQGRTQDFFARGANELRAPIYLNMKQLLSCPIYLK